MTVYYMHEASNEVMLSFESAGAYPKKDEYFLHEHRDYKVSNVIHVPQNNLIILECTEVDKSINFLYSDIIEKTKESY